MIIMIGIGLSLAFTNKMIDKVPLDRNELLGWNKDELKKKHLVYSAKKGDQVVIHFIDLKNCNDTFLVSTIFSKKEKIDIVASDFVNPTTDHFCFAIRINKKHYFKEVEIRN